MLPDNNGGKCNLVWKFYSDHLKEMLQNMFDDEFTDVTLVSDDQREIEAHKFVLSSCSAVFKKMLSRNKTSNPIIYLRGVKHQELESIVHFIYNGETNCSQARVKEFLEVAKNLQIKELSDPFEKDNTEIKSDVPKENDVFISNKHVDQKIEGRIIQECVDLSNLSVATGMRPILPKITNGNLNNVVQNKMMFRCPSLQCDNVYETKTTLHDHYDIVHRNKKIPDQHNTIQRYNTILSEQYDLLNLQPEKPSLLHNNMPENSNNEETWNCSFCSYENTRFSRINEHVEKVHQNEERNASRRCLKCNFLSNNEEELTNHLRETHSLIIYSCKQCLFQASSLSSIEKHSNCHHQETNALAIDMKPKEKKTSRKKKFVESITNYACFVCQFKLPSKENLKIHMLSEHREFLSSKSSDI